MATMQNQPIVITLPTNESSSGRQDRFNKLFPKKHMIISAILQLCCAGSVAVIQIILLGLESGYYYGLSPIGSGIWCGLIFGVAGGIGLITAHRPSNCTLIAYMVMCIIASVFVVPLIVIAGIGIGTTRPRYYDEGEIPAFCLWCFQLLFGLAQAVIAITS